MPSDLVAVGELGLAGELRRVNGTSRRLAEAARLGFTRALVPPDSGPLPDGVQAIVVRDIREALKILRREKRREAEAEPPVEPFSWLEGPADRLPDPVD